MKEWSCIGDDSHIAVLSDGSAVGCGVKYSNGHFTHGKDVIDQQCMIITVYPGGETEGWACLDNMLLLVRNAEKLFTKFSKRGHLD